MIARTTQVRRLALIACLTGALLAGCTWLQRVPQDTAPEGRKGTSVERRISIVSGLDSGMVLERGETMIVGQVEPGDLAPSNPLVIQVQDQTTNLEFAYSASEFMDDQGLGTSTVNLATGEFVIDCTEDLRIGEGNKLIRIVANGADGAQAVLEVPVTVTSQFPDFSWNRITSAREEYGQQMLALLSSYRAWAGSLSLAQPLVATQDRDLAILDALIMYYTYWHTHPQREGWDAAAAGLKSRLTGIQQQWPDQAGFWEEVWGGVETRLTTHLGLVRQEARLNLRRASYPGGQSGPWLWQLQEAFYRHTFSQVMASQSGTVSRWQGVLYADIGTPHQFAAQQYLTTREYQSQVQAGTADPGVPAGMLTVSATDANGDGLVEFIEWEALINVGPGFGDMDLGPHPQQGAAASLVEPLAALGLSYWWE